MDEGDPGKLFVVCIPYCTPTEIHIYQDNFHLFLHSGSNHNIGIRNVNKLETQICLVDIGYCQLHVSRSLRYSSTQVICGKMAVICRVTPSDHQHHSEDMQPTN